MAVGLQCIVAAVHHIRSAHECCIMLGLIMLGVHTYILSFPGEMLPQADATIHFPFHRIAYILFEHEPGE